MLDALCAHLHSPRPLGMFAAGASDGRRGYDLRILALLLGLAAGLFGLLAPIALRTDLMSPFMALWSSTPGDELIGKIIWYGVPAAAVLGGVLATVTPGFAVVPLALAALGWVAIGLALPDQFDYRLMAPAAASGLAAVLALVSAELAVRRRRMQRRKRRSLAEMDDGVDEIEREAALRMDPLAIPREQVVRPRRAVPLNLDDVTVAAQPDDSISHRQDLEAESEPRRSKPDIWGEAIRPERENPVEVEQVVEFEPEPQPSPAQRGFRWDRADAPIGQRFPGAQAPGPRIVEVRRASPAPEPRPRPVAEQERPVAAEAARPAAVREAMPNWPEPEVGRSRWTDEEPAHDRRRGGGLAPAALLAVVIVLLVGAVATGGYFAYRAGWVTQLVATAMPAPDVDARPDGPVVASTEIAASPEPARQALAPPEPELPATAPGTATPETSALATLPAKPAAAPAAQALAGPTYTDPFAYCSSVGTVDFVDERYRGPLVIPVITRALAVPDNAPRDRVHWRCAGGTVVACASYIGPVCDLAPTVDEMRGYCARNPNAPQLLAAHGAWSCVNGQPRLPSDASWPVDGRGFRADSWVVVKPAAAPAS